MQWTEVVNEHPRTGCAQLRQVGGERCQEVTPDAEPPPRGGDLDAADDELARVPGASS